jgi:hypothetical protein
MSFLRIRGIINTKLPEQTKNGRQQPIDEVVNSADVSFPSDTLQLISKKEPFGPKTRLLLESVSPNHQIAMGKPGGFYFLSTKIPTPVIYCLL